MRFFRALTLFLPFLLLTSALAESPKGSQVVFSRWMENNDVRFAFRSLQNFYLTHSVNTRLEKMILSEDMREMRAETEKTFAIMGRTNELRSYKYTLVSHTRFAHLEKHLRQAAGKFGITPEVVQKIRIVIVKDSTEAYQIGYDENTVIFFGEDFLDKITNEDKSLEKVISIFSHELGHALARHNFQRTYTLIFNESLQHLLFGLTIDEPYRTAVDRLAAMPLVQKQKLLLTFLSEMKLALIMMKGSPKWIAVLTAVEKNLPRFLLNQANLKAGWTAPDPSFVTLSDLSWALFSGYNAWSRSQEFTADRFAHFAGNKDLLGRMFTSHANLVEKFPFNGIPLEHDHRTHPESYLRATAASEFLGSFADFGSHPFFRLLLVLESAFLRNLPLGKLKKDVFGLLESDRSQATSAIPRIENFAEFLLIRYQRQLQIQQFEREDIHFATTNNFLRILRHDLENWLAQNENLFTTSMAQEKAHALKQILVTLKNSTSVDAIENLRRQFNALNAKNANGSTQKLRYPVQLSPVVPLEELMVENAISLCPAIAQGSHESPAIASDTKAQE